MLIVEPLFDTHEIMNLHNLNDVHHIRCPEIQNLKSVCCLYTYLGYLGYLGKVYPGSRNGHQMSDHREGV